MPGGKRNASGRYVKTEIAPELRQAVVDAWKAGMPRTRMQTEFGIGHKRIGEIVKAAGCDPRGASWRPPPAFRARVAQPKPKKLDKPGIRAGEALKRMPVRRDPDYTDPDAKRLMRRFCPVHRACIVDPKAPPDEWVVGTRRVSEEEMRRMAQRAWPWWSAR